MLFLDASFDTLVFEWGAALETFQKNGMSTTLQNEGRLINMFKKAKITFKKNDPDLLQKMTAEISSSPRIVEQIARAVKRDVDIRATIQSANAVKKLNVLRLFLQKNFPKKRWMSLDACICILRAARPNKLRRTMADAVPLIPVFDTTLGLMSQNTPASFVDGVLVLIFLFLGGRPTEMTGA